MKVTLARNQRSQKRVIKRELKLEDHRECLENKKLIPRSQQKQEIF